MLVDGVIASGGRLSALMDSDKYERNRDAIMVKDF